MKVYFEKQWLGQLLWVLKKKKIESIKKLKSTGHMEKKNYEDHKATSAQLFYVFLGMCDSN